MIDFWKLHHLGSDKSHLEEAGRFVDETLAVPARLFGFWCRISGAEAFPGAQADIHLEVTVDVAGSGRTLFGKVGDLDDAYAVVGHNSRAGDPFLLEAIHTFLG